MIPSTKLLSDIRFASLLAYATKDKSDQGIWHSNIVKRLKYGELKVVKRAVTRLFDDNGPASFRMLFTGGVTLVPVPRRRPLREGDFWPGEFLCRNVVESVGEGEVLPLLVRKTPVRKSATAAPGERPLPREHLASLALRPLPLRGKRVVLFDDVITRGSTMLAAASLLKEAYPSIDLTCFAMVRAITDEKLPGSGKMFQPVEQGHVYLRGEETVREP